MRCWVWISLVFLLGGISVCPACSGGDSARSQSSETAENQGAVPQPSSQEAVEGVSESAVEGVEEESEPVAAEERLLNYEESNGQVLYLHYCAVCHGATGEGDGLNAFNLRPAEPRNFTDTEAMSQLTDSQLAKVISEGGSETGHSKFMPAWGKTLTDREVRYLISYLRVLATTTESQGADESP